MAKEVPGPWVRRPLSIVTLVVATALTPIVAPIAIVVAGLWDLLTRTPRFRRTRVVTLIAGLVLVDFAGFILVSLTWLVSPIGWEQQRATIQERYERIMSWWTNRLIAVISRVSPLPIDRSQLDETLLEGNAIIIGRHRSLLDAVLPAALLGNIGIRALYVLKEDLRWEPNIDIVGHRMRHVFVNRSSKDPEAELDPIRALASRIDDRSCGVIFPEGTFFTPRRKARAIESLRKRNTEHAALAEDMDYVLPPRPAGTLALLEAAPDADVVILGHVGFEPFGTISSIIKNLGAEHSIIIKAWRFARSSVPLDPQDQIDWLFERWGELDDWIAAQHPLEPSTPLPGTDR